MPTEIRRTAPVFVSIEHEAKKAFPGGSVLRVQEVRPNVGLVLLNTNRAYGHFAILEYNVSTGGLHTGHYFDSMSEAVLDFNNRGGDLGL